MKIIFVTHRVPYPPNKGEKQRAFNLIKYLSREHEIHLFSLSECPFSTKHRAELERYCRAVHIYPLGKYTSRLKAAICFASFLPVTFGFFFSFRMWRDIRRAVCRKEYDLIFSYCSSTAVYALFFKEQKKAIDLVDIDSRKWEDFSKLSRFPLSFIYALESSRLKRWERIICRRFNRVFLTTERERGILTEHCPEEAQRISVINCGVDLEFFKEARNNRKEENNALVFTGQMDYRPNVDAAEFFYYEIFPYIKEKIPEARFYIVGRNPSLSLKQKCRKAVVTGEVTDIRDYLKKAAVFVAPLRLSYGVQLKVLEAMASGVPVVATSGVCTALGCVPGRDLLIADDPMEFGANVVDLLSDRTKRKDVAENGYSYVRNNHNFDHVLKKLPEILKDI